MPTNKTVNLEPSDVAILDPAPEGAEVPVRHSATLYEREANLQLLIGYLEDLRDLEARSSAGEDVGVALTELHDAEVALHDEVEVALAEAVDKRERFGQFILQTEADAEFCRAEARRITERARLLEAASERLRGWAVDFLLSLPRDAKGKVQKLKARTLTISARAIQNEIRITAPEVVPLSYQRVTVSMPAPQWEAIVAAAGAYMPTGVTVERSVDKAAIKVALNNPCKTCGGSGCVSCGYTGKTEIPGVDVVVDRYTLQIK